LFVFVYYYRLKHIIQTTLRFFRVIVSAHKLKAFSGTFLCQDHCRSTESRRAFYR